MGNNLVAINFVCRSQTLGGLSKKNKLRLLCWTEATYLKVFFQNFDQFDHLCLLPVETSGKTN